MQNRKAFLEAVQQPTASLDTTHCALLFSQALNPGLDVQHHTDILHTLVDEAVASNIDCAEALLSFVHEKHRFRGNTDEYYQIENSLLDSVLDKKVGIPISLALVYLAIGNSTELSVYGISFPGHFLIGVNSPILQANTNSTPSSAALRETSSVEPTSPTDTLIDPFAARIVSRQQCYKLLEQLHQRKVEHNDKYFAPSGKDKILLRLIENIKAIFLKQGNADMALTCLDYQLLISPHDSNLLNQQQQLLTYIKKHGGESSVVH